MTSSTVTICYFSHQSGKAPDRERRAKRGRICSGVRLKAMWSIMVGRRGDWGSVCHKAWLDLGKSGCRKLRLEPEPDQIFHSQEPALQSYCCLLPQTAQPTEEQNSEHHNPIGDTSHPNPKPQTTGPPVSSP